MGGIRDTGVEFLAQLFVSTVFLWPKVPHLE